MQLIRACAQIHIHMHTQSNNVHSNKQSDYSPTAIMHQHLTIFTKKCTLTGSLQQIPQDSSFLDDKSDNSDLGSKLLEAILKIGYPVQRLVAKLKDTGENG